MRDFARAIRNDVQEFDVATRGIFNTGDVVVVIKNIRGPNGEVFLSSGMEGTVLETDSKAGKNAYLNKINFKGTVYWFKKYQGQYGYIDDWKGERAYPLLSSLALLTAYRDRPTLEEGATFTILEVRRDNTFLVKKDV